VGGLEWLELTHLFTVAIVAATMSKRVARPQPEGTGATAQARSGNG
jgi:hypothetical protein